MVLAVWQRTITDDAGNVLPIANVEVRAETGGAPLAVIYSDRAGAVPIANPFTADSTGFAQFFTRGGAYKITASLNGSSRQWRYVPIGTLAERDADSVDDLTGHDLVLTGSITIGGWQDFTEISVPAAPGTNIARVYAVDDGAGITTLAMKDASSNIVPLSHGKGTETGAVARSYLKRFLDGIWAADFGVVANGSTDDATAMQNAITAAISRAVPLFLPIGTIKINSQLLVPSPLTMIGWGRERTVFTLGSTTQNGINISANDTGACNFQGFGITAAGTQTAGAGILVDSSGSHINYESRFIDLRFSNLFNGVDFERAAYWVMDGCAWENCRNIFLVIKNLADVDGGDSYLVNCLFEYFNTVTSANRLIEWQSSGGLKVVNCKFAGGYRGLTFNLASGAGTGSIVLVGNSIENHTNAGIYITSQTASPVLGTLEKMVISGNEIGGFGNGSGIVIANSSTPAWCKAVNITGNTIATGIDGTGTTAKAIDIDYAQNITIVGNTLKGNGGSTIGINLGSNASIVSKLGNSITGFGTAIVDVSTSPVTEALRGGLTCQAGGLGYATGAGGQVTQLTSKTTAAPACNALTGEITMNNATLNFATTVNFTCANSFMGATDSLIVNHVAGGTHFGSYVINGRPNGAGSMAFDVRNIEVATNLGEAIVLKFTVVKAVTS